MVCPWEIGGSGVQRIAGRVPCGVTVWCADVMLRGDHFGMSGDHLLSSAQDFRASQLRPQAGTFVARFANVAARRTIRGLLLWIGGSGVRGVSGRVPCGVAV